MDHKSLESLVHKEIPITQALDIRIESLTPLSIQVRAPFEANKNIHNTAFAGSIYTVGTIAGWSLVNSLALSEDLKGSVVLAKADIQYKKPINGDIVAITSFDNNDVVDQFIKAFKRKNRSRITLTIDVVEDDVTKAQLVAIFALVGK